MKLAKLLHNPKAGEKGLSRDELLAFIQSEGWECRYSSTKEKGWEFIEPETDFVIIAGGDGTIRKAASQLLQRKLLDKKLPIAVLPMGTANNIAKTLGIQGDTPHIVQSWNNRNTRLFDIGRIEGLTGADFFLEAMGYGVFPRLIKDMKNLDPAQKDTPEKELKLALQVLHGIILSYEAKYCKLEIDGTNYSGKFMMLEVMNTRSLGPNLALAPDADPGDGLFDVILIPEDQKGVFADFVLALINGKDETVFPFDAIKAREITLQWEGPHLHIDDTLIKTLKPAEVHIQLQAGMLEFLVPVT